MARIFPTQIVHYLDSQFGSASLNELATVQQKVGAIAGFCELYAQLPHELIRLATEQYADLVAAVGTISFGVDQFRRTGNPELVKTCGVPAC
jgi:hypothetical protein